MRQQQKANSAGSSPVIVGRLAVRVFFLSFTPCCLNLLEQNRREFVSFNPFHSHKLAANNSLFARILFLTVWGVFFLHNSQTGNRMMRWIAKCMICPERKIVQSGGFYKCFRFIIVVLNSLAFFNALFFAGSKHLHPSNQSQRPNVSTQM